MKKIYRFSSLLLLTPMIGVITSCHNDTNLPVIGYGYLDSFEVSDEGLQQPDFEEKGDSFIWEDKETGTITEDIIKDNKYWRFDTLDKIDDQIWNITWQQWLSKYIIFSADIHFNKSDFNDPEIWSWLSEKGTYKVNPQQETEKDLSEIFDPKTLSHFQFGFNVYNEISQKNGMDPEPRAKQWIYKASSTTLSAPEDATPYLNKYLTLNINSSDDVANWNLSWKAPFKSFYSTWWDASFKNLEFKLMTNSIDVSQLITSTGKIIGFKYAEPPKNEYFTFINNYSWKTWVVN